jgi:hypothetical protein
VLHKVSSNCIFLHLANAWTQFFITTRHTLRPTLQIRRVPKPSSYSCAPAWEHTKDVELAGLRNALKSVDVECTKGETWLFYLRPRSSHKRPIGSDGRRKGYCASLVDRISTGNQSHVTSQISVQHIIQSLKIPCTCFIQISDALSMPQPRNSLSDADIVCLERVQCHAEGKSTQTESPVRGGTNLGNALLGEVVDDA